ncbi:MAG: HD domain-containing protein [Acholeplasma sp.]|jgi:uncharacterized protein|nr:MAG: HD domain-containing protein [Acholeplasma sp.]
MHPALTAYLHEKIIPIYQSFDPAHQKDHVFKVIDNSLKIAADYDVDLDMVYVVACYHDIGIKFGRDNHHLTGGLFLYEDRILKQYFTEEKRQIMREAVEDHRASREHPPRSIYGKIIAEADRDISPEIVMKRTIQFGFKHYPNLKKDEHIDRAYQHILDKYGPNGYLTLWLDTEKNREGLKSIHQLLNDKPIMLKTLENLYQNEKKRNQ